MKNIFKSISLSAILVSSFSAHSAPQINPPSIPAINTIAASVKSNIMYILDDSGSMAWDYLGDEVNNGTTMCRTTNSIAGKACNANAKTNSGYDAPFMAYKFNKIYFNPNLDYTPPLDSKGNSYPNKTLANAGPDPFLSPNAVQNLNTTLTEVAYCNSSNVCKKNGIDNADANGVFDYSNAGYPNATYTNPKLVATTPHYYDIIPNEYCDLSGKNCIWSSTPNGIYTEPAYVRYCTTKALASQTSLVSGTTCQSTYNKSASYIYPRFGKFKRVAITSPDMIQKYANWFSYYRTRINAMKSAVSLTFADPKLTEKRVGFITINAGSSTAKFLPIADFNQTQKDAFYTKLFSQTTGNSTPLREALSRVGRYYGGYKDGFMITGSGANLDPVLYSCQLNATILSTDGYWNGNNGYDIKGTSFSSSFNPDGTINTYSTREDVTTDGNGSNSSYTPSGGSLADVAMYYYANNIRSTYPKNSSGTDVSISNVAPRDPTGDSIEKDTNTSPHMNTFTISLGLNGFMNYDKDYDLKSNLNPKAMDFKYVGGYQSPDTPFSTKVAKGTSAYCSWNNGADCNWPKPVADTASAIDDLWHAAVNGRGHYYSAQNPQDIVEGIKDALDRASKGSSSGSAAASTSPKITTGDNYIFSSIYTLGDWGGNLTRTTIDMSTGKTSGTPDWSAASEIAKTVSSNSDTRKILFVDNSGNKLKLSSFKYTKDNSSSGLQGQIKGTIYEKYFNGLGVQLTQYSGSKLKQDQKDLLNDSDNTATYMVDFLRGQTQYKSIFNEKKQTLGDFMNSPATYVGVSRYKWSDSGYANFVTQQAKNTPMVYIGGNDGMLHAFNATNGKEEWAIIPSQVMPKMYKMADANYPENHQYYVDGQIVAKDVFVGGSWRTYLIAGLGAGGKGYLILDITDPSSPKVVNELCADPNLCSLTDTDFGYTYGNALITKRGYDERWVAYFSNGYDSANGAGILYEYDLESNSFRKFKAPGVTSATNQVGLGQINAYYENFDANNKTNLLYAGGLNGNLYRVDLSLPLPTLDSIAQTTDPVGAPQPISTKVSFAQYGGKLLVLFGTGQLFNSNDSLSKQTQSVYTIKETSIPYGNIRSLTSSSIVKQTLTSSGNTSKSSNTPMDWNTKNGWMMDLTSQAGERVNVSPEVAVGTLNILSNVPSSVPCTAGGNYWYYQIDFVTGGSVDGNPAGTKYDNLAVGQLVVRIGDSDKMINIITDSKGQTNSADMYAKAKDDKNLTRNVVKAGWREMPTTSGKKE